MSTMQVEWRESKKILSHELVCKVEGVGGSKTEGGGGQVQVVLVEEGGQTAT